VSYSRTEEVAHASQVEHPLVREALALLGIEGGIEITSVADIPARGTGLGSSSSFTVGLLNALHAYCGRHASAARLTQESCEIELARCGEPIGKQDQYAAAFGGMNFIRFHPDESVEVKKVVCPPSVLAELGEANHRRHGSCLRAGCGKGRSGNISGCNLSMALPSSCGIPPGAVPTMAVRRH
jgi:D-glycero-alpha-D-manno-heptose-7-phosphate kinase